MSNKLNAEQAAAASHPRGHAVVLAGPGTGKTTTLVARHSYLRARGRASSSIMVVTFTSKAAEELRARLGQHVTTDAFIGTFHGLSTRLLKRFHKEAGLRPSFRILDPQAQRKLISDLGIRWEADDGDLTDIIGRWKDGLITPDQAAARVAGTGDGPNPLRYAAEHYAAYEEELRRRGDLDFADLVSKAMMLIRDNETVGRFVGERFSDILVDEFQDVNLVQAEFLTACANKGSSIWAVADDDQALYGWRGGDVRLTVNFAKRFEGARNYTLVTNYRCAPAVLAVANTLIGINKTRFRKSLKASRGHEGSNIVRMRGFRAEREEAEFVAKDLSKRIAAGEKPRDMCVLFRTASVTPTLQQALENASVPFALTGAASFWEMPEVLAVVDLLIEIEAGVPGDIAAKSRVARDLVSTMRGSPPTECAPAAGRAIAASPPAGASQERIALWSDTAEAAASIAVSHPNALSFSQYVDLMATKSGAEAADAVALSTIHSAKGLEWKHVYIVGCEATMMPHHRSIDIEEERRLLYVALTRSRGGVDVCFSRSRFSRAQQPSPFLSEMATSPRGATSWVGEQPELDRKRSAAGGAAGSSPAVQSQKGASSSIRTYRKRGARSLIPPGEE